MTLDQENPEQKGEAREILLPSPKAIPIIMNFLVSDNPLEEKRKEKIQQELATSGYVWHGWSPQEPNPTVDELLEEEINHNKFGLNFFFGIKDLDTKRSLNEELSEKGEKVLNVSKRMGRKTKAFFYKSDDEIFLVLSEDFYYNKGLGNKFIKRWKKLQENGEYISMRLHILV